MKEYAVFLDIDGTFLDSKGQLIQENLDVVNKYIEKGHKFFICSGRPRGSIHDYIKNALPWSGIISSAGSEIIIGNEEVKRDEISKEASLFLAEQLSTEKGWMVFGNGKDGICMNIEPRVRWRKAESVEELSSMYEYTTKIDFAPVSDELKEKIEKKLGNELSFYYYIDYVEGIKKGNSKATALKFILERLGMDISQSIAIGDSQNDLEILNAAGIGVAMKNASEEVKKEADMVTDTNDNAGVAKVLKEVLK